MHVDELLQLPLQQQFRQRRSGSEPELLLADAGNGRKDVQLAFPGEAFRYLCLYAGRPQKLPNVHKSCPKIIPLEKMKDFNTFTKIA